MEYPFFEVPRLGGGMLIALVAISHILIAHFAVGGGIYMAVTHWLAIRRGDELLLRYLRDHSRFLILLAFVAGAVSGVGIWITIGLVSPAATSRLVHNFVWGWAAEYAFFVSEIVAGYVYYYGWGRLSSRQQLAAGWIYAISAFMSLFIINGILTFMLTPSMWADMLASKAFNPNFGFWLGIFNDTFWPSLVLRTISSLALAAIFVAVIVNVQRKYSRDEKQRIINIGAYYMIPLVLMPPAAIWYFGELPRDVRTLAFGGAVAMTLFMAFGVAASLMIGGYAYFGLLRRKRYINLETSLLLLAIAFVATGSMEFVREGIRKPYLIYGVLYSNGIPATPEWKERMRREGSLAQMPFIRAPGQTVDDIRRLSLCEAGELVYRAQCRICHESNGSNALEPLVRDKSRMWLLRTTSELDRVRHFMPPFLGDDFELKAVVEYQLKLGQREAYQPPDAAYLRTPVDVLLNPRLSLAKSRDSRIAQSGAP